MASHKPTIQVHFSFGEHVSKGHAKNALRQLEGMGPFDLYSPEVAILQGQRDILSRNLSLIHISEPTRPY